MECRKFWTKGWPGKCCGRHKEKLGWEKQFPELRGPTEGRGLHRGEEGQFPEMLLSHQENILPQTQRRFFIPFALGHLAR